MAEKHTGIVIVPKTDEQLRQQFGLVQLRDEVKGGFARDTPAKYAHHSALFTAEVAKGIIDEDKEKVAERGGKYLTPFRKDYLTYINALRQIRQEQDPYIEQQLSASMAAGESLVDQMQKAAEFNTVLAEAVLTQVIYRTNFRVTEEEQAEIVRAKRNPQAYISYLNQFIDKHPQGVLRAGSIVSQILPAERMNQLVHRPQTQNEWLRCFRDAAPYLSPEERLATLNSVEQLEINDTRRSSEYGSLMLALQTKAAAEVLSPAQQRQLALQAMNGVHTLSGDDIAELLNAKLINLQDAQAVLFDRVDSLKQIRLYAGHFEQIGVSMEQLQQKMLEAYSQKITADDLHLALIQTEDLLTPEQRKQMLQTIIDKDPVMAATRVNLFASYFSTGELQDFVGKVLVDPQWKTNTTIHGRLFGLPAAVISNEDKRAMGLQIVEAESDLFAFMINLSRIVSDLDSDGRQVYIQQLLERGRPTDLFYNCDQWNSFVDSADLQAFIEAHISDPQVCYACLRQINIWGPKLDSSYVYELLKSQIENQDGLISNLRGILPYVPESERQQFTRTLFQANPAHALVYLDFDKEAFAYSPFTFSSDDVVHLARTDQSRLVFAPHKLSELLTQVDTNVSIEKQKALINDLLNIYTDISLIKSNGLEDQFQAVQAAHPVHRAQEQPLVAAFACLGLFKSSDTQLFNQFPELGANVAEINQTLHQMLVRKLGIEGQADQKHIESFVGVMESPLPFVRYLLQWQSSSEHMQLLKGMYSSISEGIGNYSEWKYGPDTEEGLAALISEQLLPPGLTLEQYRLWRNDHQTTAAEALNNEVTEVSKDISRYMEDNLDHLQVGDLLDQLEKKQALTPQIDQRIFDLGQLLIPLNIAKSEAARSKDTVKVEQLTTEANALRRSRDQWRRLKLISALMNLKPIEITSGKLANGKDATANGEELTKVIRELRASAAEDDQFVYDNVLQKLSVSTEAIGKENVIGTDSSNPKVALEIGEIPVASCQSYNRGSHNECLLAYFDPNTKILVLRNDRKVDGKDKGSIIARSVLRLLSDADGKPALHIERIYSSSNNPSIIRMVYNHALQKAEQMKVPVYVSLKSHNENGQEREADQDPNFNLTETEVKLVSTGSRAPKVYVDSAGGVNQKGQFQLNKLGVVSKAPAKAA